MVKPGVSPLTTPSHLTIYIILHPSTLQQNGPMWVCGSNGEGELPGDALEGSGYRPVYAATGARKGDLPKLS